MSTQLIFNPLVKKGFDLNLADEKIKNDYYSYLQNNYSQKDHTHDFQAVTIHKQLNEPAADNRDSWIID